MYIAYYIIRTSDDDADLCAVIEDGDSIFDDLASSLQKTIEQTLSQDDEWFKIENADCNFPDVWTSLSTGRE